MNTLNVYTAQMRYPGKDRFDITVKSGHKAFAPTWDMVMGIKNGTMTEAQYTERYRELMSESVHKYPGAWSDLLLKGEVTLVCYCPKGAFCHRYLLVKILQYIGKLTDIEVIYKGEREIGKKVS